MKKTKHIIRIPNPCDQDWEAMEISPNGRFCTVCQQHLYDFSSMSDAQIIRIIEKSKGKTCGRYDENQLNRLLVDPSTRERPAVWKVLLSALLLSGSNLALTQTSVPSVEINPKTPSKVNKDGVPRKIKKSYLFEGQVVNPNSELPIPFVTMELLGTDLVIESDEQGKFKLEIPGEYVKNELEFKVSKNGYESNNFSIPLKALPLCKKIELTRIRSRYIMGAAF